MFNRSLKVVNYRSITRLLNKSNNQNNVTIISRNISSSSRLNTSSLLYLNNNENKYIKVRSYCSTAQQQQHQDQTEQKIQQIEQETVDEETEFKEQILENALKHVTLYGWSETAISKACTDLGYEPTLHSLFENGGYDLAYYFVTKCNRQLKEKLTADVLSPLTQRERVKLALKMRLSMIAPYINRWSEAMQLLAHPKNIVNSMPSMTGLVDEIWHLVDDRSTDFEWYTKRGALVALYTSSELYMLNDTSPEFVSTWRFVDDRVDDMISLLKFKNDIGQSVSLTANMLLNMVNKK